MLQYLASGRSAEDLAQAIGLTPEEVIYALVRGTLPPALRRTTPSLRVAKELAWARAARARPGKRRQH